MNQKVMQFKDGDNGSMNGEERMLEWEIGLPNADKLAPLSQSLIPQELASAFRILMEPCRTTLDVDSATKATLLNIRGEGSLNFGMVDRDETTDQDGSGPESRVGFDEMANVASRIENPIRDSSDRALKRTRLTWTPQLHKRFVDVVSHLGLEGAVPKNIMQLMNVEGLTRENVASHLQKYRLYLKRTQIPIPTHQSRSDSTTSADACSNRYFPATFPMMPVMYFGMGAQGHGHSHMSMPMVNQGIESRSLMTQRHE